ncbi:MAG: hypothetical protein K2H21_05710, partial [Muribaculaceae bacterium]|nr:hypothetical protein [Muribaculaceae bacterium]
FSSPVAAETATQQQAAGKDAKKSKKDNQKNNNKKQANGRDKRQWVAEVNKISAREKADKKRVDDETAKAAHAAKRKSLKSSR